MIKTEMLNWNSNCLLYSPADNNRAQSVMEYEETVCAFVVGWLVSLQMTWLYWLCTSINTQSQI
jgi:hypothetical protein